MPPAQDFADGRRHVDKNINGRFLDGLVFLEVFNKLASTSLDELFMSRFQWKDSNSLLQHPLNDMWFRYLVQVMSFSNMILIKREQC